MYIRCIYTLSSSSSTVFPGARTWHPRGLWICGAREVLPQRRYGVHFPLISTGLFLTRARQLLLMSVYDAARESKRARIIYYEERWIGIARWAITINRMIRRDLFYGGYMYVCVWGAVCWNCKLLCLPSVIIDEASVVMGFMICEIWWRMM